MSGKPPFYGLQHPAILYRVIEDQSPRPEDHDSISTSDPLWSLMRRCWDMNPEARPRMAEILNEVSVSVDSVTQPHSDLQLGQYSSG